MLRTILAVVLMLVAISLPLAHSQVAEPFRFIHITDSRVSATSSLDNLKKLVTELNAMSPKPAFVIETGEISQTGRPEEFERFSQVSAGLSMSFYAAPGGHDVRWSPTGKEAFTNAFKRTYGSFDYHECHFVLLDSTILLERFGHLDNAQLKWLEADLKKLKKGTPVFLFVRHWIEQEKLVLDNQEDLLRILSPFKVIAAFFGHVPEERTWRINGIQCFMTLGPHAVDVDSREIQVTRLASPGNEKPFVPKTIALESTPRRLIALGWDDANLSILSRRTFLAELKADNKVVNDSKLKAEYSIDGAAFAAMEPDDRRDLRERKIIEGRFRAQFETRGLGNGTHRLRVRFTAPDNARFEREEPFAVEQVSGQPKQEWKSDTGEAIQSSPVLVDKVVYIGSNDGKLYSFDAANGKRKWAVETKGAVTATPIVADGVVYAGSQDHFLYAVDAASGSVKWRFDAHCPVFATPAVSNGIVCLGANTKIYGLEASTGKPKWTKEAPGYFQSRATAADGVFFLGGWNNTLFALDSETGAVKWIEKMGREKRGTGELDYFYSPAVASPTVAEGRVYVCTLDGGLHCLEAKTGKHAWTTYAPEGGDYLGRSSPLVANGKVFVGGSGEEGRGECYAFNAETGAIIWRCTTGADNEESSPAVAGNSIVIGSREGKLSWIDAGTGKLVNQYALEPGFSFSSPAITENGVYIPSMNGSLYFISTPKAAAKVGRK